MSKKILIIAVLLFVFISINILSEPVNAQNKYPGNNPGLKKFGGNNNYNNVDNTVSEACSVSLSVIRRDLVRISNPSEQMYSVELKVKNNGPCAVQFTNNNFFLEDAAKRRYPLTRARSTQGMFVEPGNTLYISGLYFTVPKTASIRYVILLKSGKIIARSPF